MLKDTAGCPDLAILRGRYYEPSAHSIIAKRGVFKVRSLEEDTDSASVIIRPNERVVPGRIYWRVSEVGKKIWLSVFISASVTTVLT